MEAWRLIQENAMAEHRADMGAFKQVLRQIANRLGCEWQHLGGEDYERMTATERRIFSVCMGRLEAN